MSEKGEKKNDEHKIQALLKEWGLCQDDANAHNQWAWQIGAIFIALSFAAMWISFQVEVSKRFVYSIGLCIFSMGTFLIWCIWIVLRARFYIKLAYKRARDVEHEIVQLCYDHQKGELRRCEYEEPTHILHTFIQEEDKTEWKKSKWGVVAFFLILVISWIIIIVSNYAL